MEKHTPKNLRGYFKLASVIPQFSKYTIFLTKSQWLQFGLFCLHLCQSLERKRAKCNPLCIIQKHCKTPLKNSPHKLIIKEEAQNRCGIYHLSTINTMQRYTSNPEPCRPNLVRVHCVCHVGCACPCPPPT